MPAVYDPDALHKHVQREILARVRSQINSLLLSLSETADSPVLSVKLNVRTNENEVVLDNTSPYVDIYRKAILSFVPECFIILAKP